MTSAFEAQPRVFVVDDEEAIAKMLAVVLQMNLFNAIPFVDPQAALDAAKETPPDYLISDVAMPGMNGVELAIAIQSEFPACKVLLFSGQVGAPALIEEARKAGHSFGLVEKPIHPTRMVEAIRNL